jgi:5-methylthioribose kinase
VIELSARTLGGYLRDLGVVPDDATIEVEELGWGISNLVCKATWRDGAIVVKQALPMLRVEDEWHFSRSRIRVEYDCMRYLDDLLADGSVPHVVFVDPDNYTFGMTCVPPGGVLWKEALLAGQIDLDAARRVGELLGRIHRTTSSDPVARARFADRTVLIEGRVDPYHLTTARRHPDVAPMIRDEVDRLLATGRALVLGDYSPKNTFVYPDRIVIIDFEVAHWGDPAFDVAFCLTHLVLKACRFPARADDYLEAASRFCDAYGPEPDGTVTELGCLLLARIDGKSKIEYITDEATKSLVRRLAKSIIREPAGAVRDTLGLVAGATRATA